MAFPTNGNIPFISSLKLAINFNKKVGANRCLRYDGSTASKDDEILTEYCLF